MQLDWIDDILAVIDTGSLARAADQRLLTQPAFTRRVRGIETRLGLQLFDRSRKPVTILPGVMAMEPELRELSARLRRLEHDLKISVESGGRGVAFACQHAITATISPWIVKLLTSAQDQPVRVRSGNRDACLMQLLSGDADFAVAYDWTGGGNLALPDAFGTRALGTDQLVPVAAPSLMAALEQTEIPAITYPSDVFLGRVASHAIHPRLPDGTVLLPKAETALTLAACEYALDGIGVAWLPLSLVRPHLEAARLLRVPGLPAEELSVVMIRLAGRSSRQEETVWRLLGDAPDCPGLS